MGVGAEAQSFAGTLTLENLRMNQLKLARNLTGSLALSRSGFQIHAKVRSCPRKRSAYATCDGVPYANVPNPKSANHTYLKFDRPVLHVSTVHPFELLLVRYAPLMLQALSSGWNFKIAGLAAG